MKAIERRERRKHRRYPGTGMYPFVLDVRGRWGREAHAFVQSMAGSLPKAQRAAAIRNCRRLISVALQNGIANQFHSAGRPVAAETAVSYANNLEDRDANNLEDRDDDMHSVSYVPRNTRMHTFPMGREYPMIEQRKRQQPPHWATPLHLPVHGRSRLRSLSHPLVSGPCPSCTVWLKIAAAPHIRPSEQQCRDKYVGTST